MRRSKKRIGQTNRHLEKETNSQMSRSTPINHSLPPRKVRTLIGLFRATIDTIGAKHIQLEFAEVDPPMEADLSTRTVTVRLDAVDFFFRSHKTAIAVFAEEIANIELQEPEHTYALWRCFVTYLDKLGIKPKDVIGHAVRRASFSRYCRKHNLV